MFTGFHWRMTSGCWATSAKSQIQPETWMSQLPRHHTPAGLHASGASSQVHRIPCYSQEHSQNGFQYGFCVLLPDTFMIHCLCSTEYFESSGELITSPRSPRFTRVTKPSWRPPTQTCLWSPLRMWKTPPGRPTSGGTTDWPLIGHGQKSMPVSQEQHKYATTKKSIWCNCNMCK